MRQAMPASRRPVNQRRPFSLHAAACVRHSSRRTGPRRRAPGARTRRVLRRPRAAVPRRPFAPDACRAARTAAAVPAPARAASRHLRTRCRMTARPRVRTRRLRTGSLQHDEVDLLDQRGTERRPIERDSNSRRSERTIWVPNLQIVLTRAQMRARFTRQACGRSCRGRRYWSQARNASGRVRHAPAWCRATPCRRGGTLDSDQDR
jgi:hypothetical protein